MENRIAQFYNHLNKGQANDHSFNIPTSSKKISILVQALRQVSEDKEMMSRTLYIPDDCEKYGFNEGQYNLSQMIRFLADMLEE